MTEKFSGEFKTCDKNRFLFLVIFEVDLYFLQIRIHFPKIIFQLKSLKFLSFSVNYLKHIPSGIINVDSLEKLELDNNQLTKVPGVLLKMANLKVLDVRGNKNLKENNNTINMFRKKGVTVITYS